MSRLRVNQIIPNTAAGIGIGGASTEVSAMMEFISTNQGILFPRLTEEQMALIASPKKGLVLYNLTRSRLEQYTGVDWKAADNSLDAAEVAALILVETNARISADTTLQNNLDLEAAARAAADVVLQSNIDTEENARIAADDALDAALNAEISRATAAEAVLTAEDLTFLKLSGSRPMTGSLDMGGQSITNVNLVDGVDVSAHASRHLPDGADPLATGAPSSTGSANSAGSANAFARQDHVHNTVLARTHLSSQAVFNTTSTVYIELPGLTTTPAAGTYLVMASVESTNSGNGTTRNTIAVHVGGVLVADTERSHGVAGGAQSVVPVQTVVTVNGSEVIDLRAKVVAGTGTFTNRNLTLVRIG
jgi:hypothetical protein